MDTEEGVKQHSSGPDDRNGSGEVTNIPLLMGQSMMERSGQGRVSRDPSGGKGR